MEMINSAFAHTTHFRWHFGASVRTNVFIVLHEKVAFMAVAVNPTPIRAPASCGYLEAVRVGFQCAKCYWLDGKLFAMPPCLAFLINLFFLICFCSGIERIKSDHLSGVAEAGSSRAAGKDDNPLKQVCEN